MNDKASELYANKKETKNANIDVDNYAAWGFWLAITGIFLSWIPIIGLIGLVAEIFAVVLGILALKRINTQKKTRGKGFAITAIVIGVLTILAYLAIMLLFVMFITFGSTTI